MFFNQDIPESAETTFANDIDAMIETLTSYRNDLEMRIIKMIAAYDGIEDVIDSYKVKEYYTTNTLAKNKLMLETIMDGITRMLENL